MASTLTTTNKWDAIWQDLFGSQPSAGQVATFIAEDEAVGDAATIASLIATSAVQEEVIPVAQIIQLATGLAPTVGQLSGWVAAVQSYVIGGETIGQALLNVAEAWVSNTNFQAQYGTTSTSIIEGIYAKAFGTVPTAGQIAAWSVDTPAEILLAFATSTIYTNTLAPYVTQYLTDVINAAAGEPGAIIPSGSLTSVPLPPTPEIWTLSVGTNDVTSGSPFDGQNGGADVGSGGAQTIVAGLGGPYGTTATLNGSDSIVLTGGSDTFPNTLEAFFAKSATILGVNIQGVQDFVISVATDDVCSITIAGNTTGAGPVISGLDSVTFNANETTSSLYIGDNASPVQAPGSGPFTINVNEAIGDGCNGVDVDIAAAAFVTGGLTTIDVNAEVVGGFAESNGSYIIPCPIVICCDNYDPNWCGYYADSYSITAGASAGGPTGAGHPATGAVGFTDWVVNSTGAESVGSLNIIALGGEGSTSATSLTVTDDGSNTMLFASFQSDSLGDLDWQNLSTINLSGTSGFVTLTGAEAGCFGLLGDLKGPIDIIGGTGNSFYDLTALTFTAAAGSSIQGGSNTVFDATVSELPGWSEVAFNNSVWTEDGASEGGNTVIALSNISIGDDTGSYVNGSSCATQGGSINMANFPLTPLSQPYALIAEPNPPAGTVPFGLPYTYDSTASSLPENPTLGDYLQEGVVPAGFEVLQLLDPDGSTAIELSSNLDILNGPSYFAVNMQDVSDPDEYNVSITGVESSQELVLFVSDGCSPPYCGETISTGTTSESVVSGSGSSEVFSIPVLTITNYQNVNIVLPSEGEDVGLGTKGFVVVPSDTELNTTVNFYDNVADTGGCSPGCEDNLYLGYTQTYGFEQYGYTDAFPGQIWCPESGCFVQAELIGSYSVAIEVNLDYATPPLSTINDFGTGRFEIGGTDATNINAQSTGQTGDGGLIMDLPASYFGALGALVGGSGENLFFETYGNENGQTPLGITVNGSDYGTNLLQGTSGPIAYDAAAYYNIDDNGAYFGAVGNDVLSGGPFGDNYFPEGGNDTINLSDAAALTVTGVDGAYASTVWFGFYDVGYSGCFETGTCPGAILAQAITDIDPWSSTGEQFVNGYGSDLLTINGFAFGPQEGLSSDGTPTATPGTSIIFGTSSWATDISVSLASGGTQYVEGLTQWDATTLVASQVPAQLDLAPATFYTQGTAADNQPIAAVSPGTDIVLYNLGAFSSASVVQSALTTEGVGDIEFYGTGLAPGHTADLLLAYKTTGGAIDIADITIANKSGAYITDTDEAVGSNGSLTVTNLISISNPGLVGVAELGTNPIFFTHA